MQLGHPLHGVGQSLQVLVQVLVQVPAQLPAYAPRESR
jgi:hypothetical protein